MKVINNFDKEYRWLSNFYPCFVFFEGELYPTVEHAYQASKTNNQEIRKQILNLSTPGKAKRFTKNICIINNHDKIKLRIMKDLLTQKFLTSDYLFEKLKETKNYKIIEENNWHDNYWGNCLCEKCKNIVGKNNLGKLIMKIRDNKIKEQ